MFYRTHYNPLLYIVVVVVIVIAVVVVVVVVVFLVVNIPFVFRVSRLVSDVLSWHEHVDCQPCQRLSISINTDIHALLAKSIRHSSFTQSQ